MKLIHQAVLNNTSCPLKSEKRSVDSRHLCIHSDCEFFNSHVVQKNNFKTPIIVRFRQWLLKQKKNYTPFSPCSNLVDHSLSEKTRAHSLTVKLKHVWKTHRTRNFVITHETNEWYSPYSQTQNLPRNAN